MTDDTKHINPCDNLPLNTLRSYVMAKDITGCKIYIPVADRDDKHLDFKKQQLQKFLDSQVEEQTFDGPPLMTG